jgi:hypothetical protein
MNDTEAHGISGQIAEGMAAHNEDEEAHPDLQDDIDAVQRSTGGLAALALDTAGEYLRIADVIGFTPEDLHELVNYQRMPDAEGDGKVREADHIAYQPAGNYQSAGDYAGQAEVNTSRDQAIADGFTAHNADTAAHDGRLEALETGLAFIPAIPGADGEYKLVISGGAASWEII